MAGRGGVPDDSTDMEPEQGARPVEVEDHDRKSLVGDLVKRQVDTGQQKRPARTAAAKQWSSGKPRNST